MLTNYFDKVASTKRLQFIAGTDKKDFVPYLANIPCLLQPLDAEVSQDIEVGFGKNYLLMCNLADIIDTDRVIVDGQEYRIIGIERHSWLGDTHIEVLIRIFSQ